MDGRDVELGTHVLMAEPGWVAVYRNDDGSEFTAPVWAWVIRVQRLWLREGRLSEELHVETDGLETPDVGAEGGGLHSTCRNFVRYERQEG